MVYLLSREKKADFLEVVEKVGVCFILREKCEHF